MTAWSDAWSRTPTIETGAGVGRAAPGAVARRSLRPSRWRAPALLAVKLVISQGVGRTRDPRKVGSDAFDIVRLLQRFGPDALADDLVALADRSLVERVAALAEHHVVQHADRMAAAIVRSSVLGVEVVAADQLELLGRAFGRRLRPRPPPATNHRVRRSQRFVNVNQGRSALPRPHRSAESQGHNPNRGGSHDLDAPFPPSPHRRRGGPRARRRWVRRRR